MCPRTLPRRSQFGQQLLAMLMTGAVDSSRAVDINQYGTMLYRLYVSKRPQQTPFQVDGIEFDHEMVVMPYWVQVQSHFADGWKDYGASETDITKHSALYQPRPLRGSSDWSLISTAKLWLPLGYGPPSARQPMPGSVVDMALRQFSLGISPRPYQKKPYRNTKKSRKTQTTRRLRTPADSILESSAFQDEAVQAQGKAVPHEGALPGVIGGFRTFRELRLVGREEQSQAQDVSLWSLTISSATAGLRLFCRQEHRRSSAGTTPAAAPVRSSAAFRACESGLKVSAGQGAAAGEKLLFEICGSPAEINAAMTLLAYHAKASLGSDVPAAAVSQAVGDRDFRFSPEELQGHFGQLRLAASPGCIDRGAGQLFASSTAEQALAVDLNALLDDVEDHVTVVAHCAERCHLLDRLAASFREVYAKLPIIATCECAEEEGCREPKPRAHGNVPHMTVISVPYDFGLSRGKTLLIEMTTSEFVLVLDDDFTHSFHSCLECMLWKMRSQRISAWRPFDILGFPVQEDERIFGAFRGSLRVASHQLFLEPMAEEVLPDGCIRVDICPMVFLGRTARMRTFEFQKDLSVGEHEQFFYSNAYNGAQVAVCFDSSFPHFRVNTMSAGYVKRRERMPELMTAAFQKLGFERAMFLFRKYDHGRMTDYDELLEKTVPPWYISHDTCGPPTSPPVPFAQVMIVVFSSADEAGQQYRKILRGQTDARSGIWLRRLQELAGDNTFRWVFAVHPQSEEAQTILALKQEHDMHQDLLLLPPADRHSSSSGQEANTDQLIQVFALLRDFHFRWLLITRQDVFVQADRLLAQLQSLEPPGGKVLGAWKQLQAAWRLEPHFFALPRDMFALLSAPEVISRLASSGHDAVFGDLSMLGSGLSSWMRAYAVERKQLPGMHARANLPGLVCPQGTLTLHPVSAAELHKLSRSPSTHGCTA
eukprot:TRINITY_DN94632_c0_g1_i1.p1 TRINITY_DN94632_c0_g1~~TRINITY_DN94632_c0_g1_i1.p1  ORF type:complete len:1060 (+),score=199.19 TRINITY_DN94632_c0_g1_i1:375-3182(+)